MQNNTNPKSINPVALKHYRKEKGYKTQSQLAERLGCKKDQVNRWETGRTQKPHERLRNKLIAALGVSWEDLTRDPPTAEKEPLYPPIQLGYRVHPGTRTNLELVSRMFAVRPAAILEIAPLLFLITAYKSLDDRKKKIANVREQLNQLIDNSQSAAPHLAPAFNYLNVGDADIAIEIERESIERNELFGPWNYYESFGEVDEIEKNNPFSNYIESMLDELPDGQIDKEEFVSPDRDVPDYSISMDYLGQVVGISGDTPRETQTLKFISCGYIDINKLLKVKSNLPEPDYREWLSKIDETINSEFAAEEYNLLSDGLNPIVKVFEESIKSQNQGSEGPGKKLTEGKEDIS